MPLSLSPNRHYRHVLSGDRDDSKTRLPTFVFKYLTSDRWMQVSELSDRFDKGTGGPEVMALVFEAIRATLVGWENLIDPETDKEIPYDPDKLEGLLTLHEATELMQVAVAQSPTLEDKKKLRSRSRSSTAKGAKTVRAKKTAKTNPRKQRP